MDEGFQSKLHDKHFSWYRVLCKQHTPNIATDCIDFKNVNVVFSVQIAVVLSAWKICIPYKTPR